jgi:tetraacyldisaccharide 4'-kinase
VGGTGKTPLTIWLANELMAQGYVPGIVTRGYRGNVGRRPVVATAASDPQIVGDEAILLARRCQCPVVVHPDRVAAAEKAVALGVNIIIADDGLQHLRLARDFEIVVIDGARGTGNGHLLPAGPLREPVSRLRAADAIMIQGVASAGTMRFAGDHAHPPRFFSLRAEVASRLDNSDVRRLDEFSGKTVHAVAGIGNPERFFAMLERFDMQVLRHALPDHAAIRRHDLHYDDGFEVVMTEKDAVKCASLDAARYWYVPVDLVIDDADRDTLIQALLKKIALRVTDK